jgi:hypothetical protein
VTEAAETAQRIADELKALPSRTVLTLRRARMRWSSALQAESPTTVLAVVETLIRTINPRFVATGMERVGEDLGTDARWIAGCRRQVQPPPSDPAVSHLYWASAKKGRHVAPVQSLDQCCHSERTGQLAVQAISRGIGAAGRRRSRGTLGTYRG